MLLRMLYVFLPIIAAVSGVLQSVTGFGSAILLMVFLPNFFDMLQAPAIASSITFGLSSTMAWKFRKELNWKLVLLPAVCYEIGSIIVLNIAAGLDLHLLGLAFGIFLILLALYFLLFSSRVTVSATPVSASLCSFFSGICSGLFGIGGPLLAMYFLAATQRKQQYAANLQFVFALTTSINLIIRIQKGFYTLSFLPVTIIGFLGITVGKQIGLRILDKINISLLRRLVYALVGISGIRTVWGRL